MRTSKDITADILKDQSRVVDYTKMLEEQHNFVQQARRFAGSDPSKAERAYIEEQEEKLKKLQDIVGSWVFEAFPEEDYKKAYHWSNLVENYKITVLVEKK